MVNLPLWYFSYDRYSKIRISFGAIRDSSSANNLLLKKRGEQKGLLPVVSSFLHVALCNGGKTRKRDRSQCLAFFTSPTPSFYPCKSHYYKRYQQTAEKYPTSRNLSHSKFLHDPALTPAIRSGRLFARKPKETGRKLLSRSSRNIFKTSQLIACN